MSVSDEAIEKLAQLTGGRVTAADIIKLIDRASREYLRSFNEHREEGQLPDDLNDPVWLSFVEEHLPQVRPIIIDVIYEFARGWTDITQETMQ